MINQIQDVLSMWFTIDRSAVSALTDFRVVYVASPDQASQLEVLRDSVSEKQSLLITSLKILRSLSEQAHKLAFDSVFSQIANHLHSLSESEVCVAFQFFTFILGHWTMEKPKWMYSWFHFFELLDSRQQDEPAETSLPLLYSFVRKALLYKWTTNNSSLGLLTWHNNTKYFP